MQAKENLQHKQSKTVVIKVAEYISVSFWSQKLKFQ